VLLLLPPRQLSASERSSFAGCVFSRALQHTSSVGAQSAFCAAPRHTRSIYHSPHNNGPKTKEPPIGAAADATQEKRTGARSGSVVPDRPAAPAEMARGDLLDARDRVKIPKAEIENKLVALTG